MQIKKALAKATRLLGMSLLAVAVSSPVTAFAQEGEDGEADEGATDPAAEEKAAEPAAAPPPSATTPPPPPAAPPAPPPSPFSLAVKGFVSGSIMMQDTSTAGGNYNLFLFGGRDSTTDKWMY